jgi:transcriptional regulator with XRE-family HTH domain
MGMTKFSKSALKSYRSQYALMSHEELANCSGVSARSLSRRENPDELDLIDEEELSRLANCLQIPQHKLWSELRPQANFFGTKVNDSNEFIGIIFSNIQLLDFEVRYFPNLNQSDTALRHIAQALSDLTSNDWNISGRVDLQIKISNAFNYLTDPETSDPSEFYAVRTSEYHIGEFAEATGSFWGRGWTEQIVLLNTKAGAPTPHLRKNTVIPGTGPQKEPISDSTMSLEERQQALLEARTDLI